MPNLNEGLLEKGHYWEPAKKIERTAPAHVRAKDWGVHLVRTAFSPKPGVPIRRTAWLDGLRGFAAFLVYWQHHQLWSHEYELVFENAYGWKGQYYFGQLPFIRLFFTGGHFAVVVFFVISGYVLAAKPLSLIQSGDYMKLGDNIASALFRRWLRLHIPVIVTTLIYLHCFTFGWKAAYPTPQSNYWDELWWYYCELKNFTFVFRQGGDPWFSYNFHTWSIPIEFRGSIIIYTALLAFSRCTRNARLLCQLGLIIYFMWIVDGWYGSVFVSGMLLCDLHLLAADNNLPKIFDYLKPYKKIIYYTMFVASLWLGGIPSKTSDMWYLQESPGWYYISFLKPQAVWDYKWFFLFWAAIMVTASIPQIPWMKAFFETRFNQYLGRISFALYLVHGPVIWIVGERLYAATGMTREGNMQVVPEWVNIWPMSKRGVLGFEVAFWAPQVIMLPLTFWLAELVTRLVDEPSVKFAQWCYQKTMAPAIKL
ncbi:hypothetical protein R6Q59_010205 [Mikania micrantha]